LLDKIYDRDFSLDKEGLCEQTKYEVGGSMTLIDAQREIDIQEKLIRKGFLIPQRTVALYKTKLPFQKEDAVALVQQIETDMRADELCMAILTNLFFDVYGDQCEINIENSNFTYPKYSIKTAVQILNEKYKHIFLRIGNNIGTIYQRFHNEGFLRGISNSWYGNELICDDGNFGVCDLESCFSIEEINDELVFELLCKTDINLARTAFYDSMNFFENSLASIVGSILIEGFEDGYNHNNYKPLNKEEIMGNIDKFMKIKKRIVR
jgi:hypothetical protein